MPSPHPGRLLLAGEFSGCKYGNSSTSVMAIQADDMRFNYIALTGYGRPEDRARSHAAGIDHHLTKPVNLGELARLLGLALPVAAV